MVTLKTLLANVSKSVLIISILNKENNLTVEKKHLLLDFPYLGIIYLQTRTKLQQALKVALNCCKLEISFECQTGLSNSFWYKDLIPGVVYRFHSGLCNESYCGETIRHLDIRSGEHMGVLTSESLLIVRDKPSIDKNINSAPLYLFNKVSKRFLPYFTLVDLTSLVYSILNIFVKL